MSHSMTAIIHSLVGKWNYCLYFPVSVQLPHIYLDWNTVVFLGVFVCLSPFFSFFRGVINFYSYWKKESVTALVFEVPPVDEEISLELYDIMFLISFALI